MVKDDRHRTRAIVSKDGEIAISMHKSVFAFISTIQNEVHRFSIEYQRTAGKKKAFSSTLMQIPGVGQATAKKLLRTMKTVHAISEATPQRADRKGRLAHPHRRRRLGLLSPRSAHRLTTGRKAGIIVPLRADREKAEGEQV